MGETGPELTYIHLMPNRTLAKDSIIQQGLILTRPKPSSAVLSRPLANLPALAVLCLLRAVSVYRPIVGLRRRW